MAPAAPIAPNTKAPEPTASVSAVAELETDAIISLAGKAAERRALRGTAPGWRRMRTRDEIRAYHEAGHAVARLCAGQYVWKLSIIPDATVCIQETGISAGYCAGGKTQEPTGPMERPARAETDLRRAARACLILAITEAPYGWRGALRIAHRLRAQAWELIDQHWPLVARLASELAERGEMNQHEIAGLLSGRV